ncbi:hypothetical protein [Streptomyces sp. MNP-20]|uniref:hypothetical protein n=1 Tax=Streptomyces sp. MNP-20 TaxID=2721165 RepID=UPI001C1DD92E|nr:hypothetical protein [Streptomyces sp. MNP-20]
MTTQAALPLEGLPETASGPSAAPQPVRAAAVGAPKGVARKGVLTALRPDPHRGDARYPIAWLHICAPYGAIPTATSKCACGRDRSAVGPGRVLALVDDHAAHRDACPLRAPQEGRAAA